jgi:hypothetical protein
LHGDLDVALGGKSVFVKILLGVVGDWRLVAVVLDDS